MLDNEFHRQRHAERISQLASDYQQPWPTTLARASRWLRRLVQRPGRPTGLAVDEAFWTEVDGRFRERYRREWRLLDALIERDDRFLSVMFHLAFVSRDVAYAHAREEIERAALAEAPALESA
jgi:hypothetical protein